MTTARTARSSSSDRRVAFTGGVGIAEEWEGDARDETEWRDTHLRFRGPVVDGLRAAFVADWKETGPPIATELAPARQRPGEVRLAGVEVHRYAPTMMHVECVLVDDEFAVVGSGNMNHRSLRKDEEVAVVVDDPGVVATLDGHFDEDLARCERVTAPEAARRPALQRVSAAALRPLRQEM